MFTEGKEIRLGPSSIHPSDSIICERFSTPQNCLQCLSRRGFGSSAEIVLKRSISNQTFLFVECIFAFCMIWRALLLAISAVRPSSRDSRLMTMRGNGDE